MVRGPDGPRARWSEDLWNKSNTNILILGLAGPRTIGPSDPRTIGPRTIGPSDYQDLQHFPRFSHTHTHTHTRRAHAHTHVLSYIHIHTYTQIQIHSYTMIHTYIHTYIHTHTHTHTHIRMHARTHTHFLVQFNAPVKIISLIETMQISRWVKAGEPRGKPPGTPESRSWLMPLVTQSSTINIFRLCLGIRLHV